MEVVEFFYSIQGEGRMAGVPSVFVRLAGCPLGCAWCDTAYAWGTDQATDMDVPEILDALEPWPRRPVVVTGGEPLVGPGGGPRRQLPELLEGLRRGGRHVTVETAGVLFVPDLACDLMSISPKLANPPKIDVSALKDLVGHYRYQLKFVVDCPEDVDSVRSILEQISDVDAGQVMLMPQARTVEELNRKAPIVAEWCKQTGWAFGPRLHLWLWAGQRGR